MTRAMEDMKPRRPVERSAAERNVGKLLRALRRSRGMSQSQIALKMRTTRAAISKMERCESVPTLRVMENFCPALEYEAWRIVRAAERAGRRVAPEGAPLPQRKTAA